MWKVPSSLPARDFLEISYRLVTWYLFLQDGKVVAKFLARGRTDNIVMGGSAGLADILRILPTGTVTLVVKRNC